MRGWAVVWLPFLSGWSAFLKVYKTLPKHLFLVEWKEERTRRGRSLCILARRWDRMPQRQTWEELDGD